MDSSNVLNIDNYTINDLISLLELKLPVSEDEINKKIDENLSTTTNNSIKTFYKNMKDKINNYMFQNGISIITDQGFGLHNLFGFKKGYKDGTVGDRVHQNVEILDPVKNVMFRKYLNEPGELRQGVNNPILRQTTQKILSISSHYRDNLLYRSSTTYNIDSSGNCQTTVNNDELIPPSSSSDFLIEFPEPVTNVVSFHVKSFEIPTSWYVFSEKQGTSYFDISCNGISQTVIIDDGNYKYINATDASNTLQEKLQQAINTAFGGSSIVIYDENTFKTTIKDVSGANTFNMTFFNENQNYNSLCGNKQTKDHNLGWMLGFRKTAYSGSTTYTSESCLDTFGPKTLFISFDDFNSNYDGHLYLANSNNSNKKIEKLPNYYNKNFCNSDGSPSISGNQVSLNEGNINNSAVPQRLTKAQVFTVEQIMEQQLRDETNRNYHSLPSNIIARISVPVTRDTGSVGDLIWLNNPESDLPEYTRDYFGPATLKRAHIKLLDDRGNIVDLNNMDWSFAISIKQFYQY